MLPRQALLVRAFFLPVGSQWFLPGGMKKNNYNNEERKKTKKEGLDPSLIFFRRLRSGRRLMLRVGS